MMKLKKFIFFLLLNLLNPSILSTDKGDYKASVEIKMQQKAKKSKDVQIISITDAAPEYTQFILSIITGDLKTFDELKKTGVVAKYCNTQIENGPTPLEYAIMAEYNNIRVKLIIISILLKNGAIVDFTPAILQHIAKLIWQSTLDDSKNFENDLKILQLLKKVLYKLGMNNLSSIIDTRDYNGETLLMKACRSDDLDFVKSLLAHGADRNIEINYLVAQQLAPNIQITEFFNNFDALRKAVKKDDIENIRKILNEFPFFLNIPICDDGKPLIILAAYHNRIKITKFLIELGADINIQDNFPAYPKKTGFTALMTAAAHNYFELAELLIDAGADINIQNCHGNSALLLAIWNCALRTAKLLINKGADIYAINNMAETVLEKAKEKLEKLRNLLHYQSDNDTKLENRLLELIAIIEEAMAKDKIKKK